MSLIMHPRLYVKFFHFHNNLSFVYIRFDFHHKKGSYLTLEELVGWGRGVNNHKCSRKRMKKKKITRKV